jgi:hypothetical protein
MQGRLEKTDKLGTTANKMYSGFRALTVQWKFIHFSRYGHRVA